MQRYEDRVDEKATFETNVQERKLLVRLIFLHWILLLLRGCDWLSESKERSMKLGEFFLNHEIISESIFDETMLSCSLDKVLNLGQNKKYNALGIEPHSILLRIPYGNHL